MPRCAARRYQLFLQSARAWMNRLRRLFRGTPAGFVIGVGTLQPAGNLLRRPLKAQLMCHKVGQRSVLQKLTDLRATASIPRRLVRLAGPIALRTLIASDLATRSWRVRGRASPRSLALTCRYTLREISSRSLRVNADRGSALLGWPYPAVSARCVDRRVVAVKQSGIWCSVHLVPTLRDERTLLAESKCAVFLHLQHSSAARAFVCCIDELNPPPIAESRPL